VPSRTDAVTVRSDFILANAGAMRILVVEDEKKVASFLEKGLREEGYAVDVAHDGDDGLMKALVHDYDLLLLDVMMPGKSGLEVVRELRSKERTTPVLLLTARDAERDVVLGLDAGADDYLTKPFGFDELLARVRALLRRGGATRPDRLLYDDVELDRVKHVALRAGERLDLTPREFQLLEYFMLQPERVVRRTELLEKVWDLHFDPMSNVVDVHVGNLRRKLDRTGEEGLLHTVRGVGYVLRKGGPA
jgi:DNA-binding response OmpR family regulator